MQHTRHCSSIFTLVPDHAINGTYFGADLHLVHKRVKGDGGNELSVLGLFLEPTSPENNKKFDRLLSGWEAVADSVKSTCSTGGRFLAESQLRGRKLSHSFNPYALIPKGSTYYVYSGSLTTPPCSEIVTWNVVDKPVQLSVREYLRLTNLILDYTDPTSCKPASTASPSGFTGRPVQPINGRTIVRKCPSVDTQEDDTHDDLGLNVDLDATVEGTGTIIKKITGLLP